MVSDNNMGDPTLARKLGRGLLRAIAGLFGRDTVRKTRDSLDVLQEEYRSGRDGQPEPPPRRVPFREVAPPRANEDPEAP